MPSEIRIYYEGDPSLRPGFDAFFLQIGQRARQKQCRLRFVSAGSGEKACQDFAIATETHPNATRCILLKDSEGPDDGNLSLALCRAQKWNRRHAAFIFWMVEMMEAWFYADKDALENYFGRGFHRDSLKRNQNVEQISKKDLKNGLRAATKNCLKGPYHKTRHAPELLGRISPEAVQNAAPNCRKLFESVLATLR